MAAKLETDMMGVGGWSWGVKVLKTHVEHTGLLVIELGSFSVYTCSLKTPSTHEVTAVSHGLGSGSGGGDPGGRNVEK